MENINFPLYVLILYSASLGQPFNTFKHLISMASLIRTNDTLPYTIPMPVFILLGHALLNVDQFKPLHVILLNAH